MIGDEDIGATRLQPLEAAHLHAHAGGGENQPRPRSRAPVREVALTIEQAGAERERAENDGVDGDRRNQPEDGPPPVKPDESAEIHLAVVGGAAAIGGAGAAGEAEGAAWTCRDERRGSSRSPRSPAACDCCATFGSL